MARVAMKGGDKKGVPTQTWKMNGWRNIPQLAGTPFTHKQCQNLKRVQQRKITQWKSKAS